MTEVFERRQQPAKGEFTREIHAFESNHPQCKFHINWNTSCDQCEGCHQTYLVYGMLANEILVRNCLEMVIKKMKVGVRFMNPSAELQTILLGLNANEDGLPHHMDICWWGD